MEDRKQMIHDLRQEILDTELDFLNLTSDSIMKSINSELIKRDTIYNAVLDLRAFQNLEYDYIQNTIIHMINNDVNEDEYEVDTETSI